MTWFFDNHSVGHAALHHNDQSYDPHFRLWSLFAALRAIDSSGFDEQVPGTYGPIFPLANLYQSIDQTLFPRLWIPHPPLVKGDSLYRIMRSWAEPESRLEVIKEDAIESPYNVAFPPGWIFTALNGVDIDRRLKLLFPGFLGIVCQKDKGEFSTNVYRADGPGLEPTAKTHSAWRVWLPAGVPIVTATGIIPAVQESASLAWRLDQEEPKGYGGGATTDVKNGSRRIGLGSAFEGGPFAIGKGKGDQHTFQRSLEDEDMGPLHTSTEQIFIRQNDSGDGPHKDSGQYVPDSPGPLLTPVYWRFDPEEFHSWLNKGSRKGGIGIWKDQATTFVTYLPPPDGFPPPKKEPPEGDPFPPLEPKKEDGFLVLPDPGSGNPGGIFRPTPLLNVEQNPIESNTPTYRGFDTPNDKRPLASAFGEIATTGQAHRASSLFHLESNTRDLRNTQPPFSPETGEALLDIWADLPILMRDEGIVSPNTTTENSRYAPGVASGVLATFPGNIGIDDFMHRPDNLPTAKTLYRLYNQIRMAFGQVDKNALVRFAFSIGLLSDTQMTINYHDTLGALTTLLNLNSAGLLALASLSVSSEAVIDTLSYKKTLGPEVINLTGSTITAPVVVKADDFDIDSGLDSIKVIAALSEPALGILLASLIDGASGHVARNGTSIISGLDTSASYKYAPVYYTSTGTLTLAPGSNKAGYVLTLANPGRMVVELSNAAPFMTETKAADFTAEVGVAYEVNTTGAARTVTLKEITKEMDGRELKITDSGNAAANNITINRSAADTIKGGASLVVIANYTSATFTAHYVAAGASVWQVT